MIIFGVFVFVLFRWGGGGGGGGVRDVGWMK